MIRYSFIIPVKAINAYIHEAVPKILAIERDDFEIIIYPNQATTNVWPKTRQIATGPGGPAMKRSLAIHDARGDVLIFIDDDAYPAPDFLDRLEQDFHDQQIAAVGGPAITPRDDSFWQKVSGAVFLSRFSGGFPERYIPIGKKRFVYDWPSVNLSVRKHVFAAVGGFDCAYWPGEDTKLCLDITQKIGGHILYDPELLVYHHRREGLGAHLKQIRGYAIHRGFFAKTLPQTSRKPVYFLPSLFVCGLIGGAVLSIVVPFFWMVYVGGIAVYVCGLGIAFATMVSYEHRLSIAAHALYYIVLTHVVYGVTFLQGFFCTPQLRSRLR